ncbi:MAG: hypothetical protein AAFQ40_03350 [Cyanobacteria bacterium J06623_5]
MATTHNNSQTQLLNNDGSPAELPQQMSQQDSQQHVNALRSEVQGAYLQGRNDESLVQEQMRDQARSRARSQPINDNTASGMLLGLIVAFLAASAGAAMYLWGTHRSAPIAVPQVERESNTERETTIIERAGDQLPERLPDVTVEVPDVNVTLPEFKVPDINLPATREVEGSDNSEAPTDTVSDPTSGTTAEPVVEGE